MRIFYTLLLLLHFEVHAKRSLSSPAFQSNVRPQLAAIINDFFQMIELFPFFPNNIDRIVDAVDRLHSSESTLQEACPITLDLKCLRSIDALVEKLNLISIETLQLQSNLKLNENLALTNISGLRMGQNFYLAVEKLKGHLQSTSLKIKAQASSKESTYQILKDLNDIKASSALLVVEFVPLQYQEEFRHFFFNFIHPIQQNIDKSKNYEFFDRNMDSLNFALNLLVQNLTKRNKKTPAGMEPYLGLIHNRWNSILRLYFG